MSDDKLEISPAAYRLMERVDAVLADGTIEDVGMILACLLGKWISVIPPRLRQPAMMEFSTRVVESMKSFTADEAPEPRKEVRH